jgi:VIT1/CCC1 family predicted Fe2+/Mn2+ transporter
MALVQKLGPAADENDAGRDEGRGMGIYDLAIPGDSGHALPRAGRRRRAPAQGLHGGGNLRAAVFGINDGLVSNASLILGIAGASPDAHVVLLTGIAGMCAGAFAMATGEYVSVRSQRELFEYQIGLERDELAQYPEAEAQELALIYTAKGLRPDEASKLATKIIADPSMRWTRWRARSSVSTLPSSGSPWGAAIRSFLSFAVGALLPLAPFMLMSGSRTLPVAIGVTAVALFAVGALLSLFTGTRRASLRSADAGSGRTRRRRHVRSRATFAGRRAWFDAISRS